jgi:LysR family glycine cleavage system transcriptional activator
MPPLNAVRVFAAAARHLSFTRAAAELHVTHSAVSRQIKTLEDHLGLALFTRGIRQVNLTLEGQQFFAEVAPALEQIGAAAHALKGRPAARVVRVNVRPSFAVRWLIPRLPDFVAQHPGIEPEVMTSTATLDKVADGFDIAIRRGAEGWPTNIKPRPFLDDQALVVGAPALFRKHPVTEPRALADHVLLTSKSRGNDWEAWKREVAAPRLKPASRLQFDHLHFVVQAALDGLGVALVPLSLITQDLRSGRLVCPLPEQPLPLEQHCHGLAHGAPPEALLFAQWLDSAQHKPRKPARARLNRRTSS